MMMKTNYKKLTEKIDKILNEQKNKKYVLIADFKPDVKGKFLLTQTTGKGSKTIYFDSKEELEKYIENKAKYNDCLVIIDDIFED